jgi:hypothetical protein
MDKHSPTPWRVVVNPLNGELLIKESGPGVSLTVGNMFKPADAEYLVEAVNGRKRDEALIASLLYHHLEDFAEAVASDSFTQVVKAAFKRLGLKYEPFGPDALEAVEKRRKELAHD